MKDEIYNRRISMEVGDYVRTENGCICKVLKYTDISDNDYYVNTDSSYNVIYKSWIVKSSPNIINLIEVGDYVNGCPVDCINYDFNKDEDIVESITIILPYQEDKDIIHNEDIKSIVTREMFESMKYNLESEVN